MMLGSGVLRQDTTTAELALSRAGSRRLWKLALPAVVAVAAVIGLTVAGETQYPHVATPHFLTRALGRQLPQHAPGRLVPKRFAPAGYATPRITNDSFSLGRGGSSISLTSAPAATGSWSRHAGGVSRRTSFGRTTITLGLNSIEQFLTVGHHLGTRMWEWNLSSLGLLPRLGSDGQVHFYKHGALTGWRVARPLIENAEGQFITPLGTQWQLSKRNGEWILALKLDDSQLPIPYTIDPGIALAGACSIAAGGTQPALNAGCTTNTKTNGTSVALTVPSGVVNGDALIAQVDTGAAITTATGFTSIDTVGSTVFQQEDYRVANSETAGTTTYTWSGSSGVWVGAMYAFTNTNTTTPVDQHTTGSGTCGASGTCTMTANAVTTAQSNEMPIALYASNNSADAISQSGSQNMTQGYTQTAVHSSTSFIITGSSGTSVQSSPGSTGSFTATATAAGQAWVSSTITLQPPFSADGQGTNVVSPTSVTQSTTGNTLAFTFTPATGGISGGAVRIQVPSTWTQPSTSNVSAGYTTASAGTLSIDTTTSPCTASSSCILVSGLTRADSQSLTVTFGSGGGSTGVTAPSSTGSSTFTTTEKSTSGGTLTAIGTSPSVTVNAAPCTSCTWTGSGTDNNWSTGANWSGDAAPATNGTATLTFPASAARLSNNNDLTSGTAFAGITISGSGYTLAGNSVALGSSGITDSTTSGSSTINLPLSMAAGRTVTVNNAAETLTLGGIVSGSGSSLTKAGSGVLTLSGTNTFTGGTTLSAGQLNVNNATALGTGTFTVSGGTIDNTSGGSITESNNNAQAWNGNFMFTGTNALDLGTGAVAMNASRQVTVSASNLTVGGVISGSTFGLTKAGSGTLTLTGVNTYTGNTTISAGTLNANSTSALGGASNTLVFSGGTLQAGGTITSLSTRAVTLSSAGTIDTNGNSVSIAGVISGSNGLTKTGTGTLTLTGTNTYLGSTTISAGTLLANSSSALGDAANTLQFLGGTLAASAPITSSRAVTLSTTGTIDTNGNAVSISGPISGAGGGLTKSGAGTLTLSGTNTFGGGLTLSAGQLNVNSATALGTGTFTISGGTIDNTSGGSITESNNNAQAWNGDFTFTGSNALNLGTGAVTLGASRQVTVSASTLTVGGVIAGSSFGLTKAGSGTLTLTGVNTYTGNTTISAGTLNANSTSALGGASNSLVFSGGTLQAGGTITSPSTRAVTLSSAGTVDTNGNGVSIAGVISGSNGLTKSGTGTLTLSGTNTYTGSTTISAGTLNANASAALGDGSATNTLVFSGGTLQAGGTITSPSTRTVTLSSAGTVDTNGNGVSIAGVISGSNGLTKSGTGTLTLSGGNTFSGGLTLSAGQLNVNNATALGTGTFTVSGGTIDNTSGGSITESNNNAQAWNGDFTFTGTNALNLGTGAVTLSASRQVTVSAGTLTVGGVVSGSGFALTKAGAGALTLSGANTFTGGATLSAGQLNINNATALGTGTFTISGGTIDNTSGGSITESNNNAQAWNGNFTFTGSNALNLGTGAVSLSASRTVIVSASNLTVGGVISGSTFGLTKAGTGTLTLAGANTYTGDTTILAGTLNANSSSALGDANNKLVVAGTLQAGGTITSPSTRAVSLSSTATIDTNGNGVSIAGVVSGPGGLSKSGSGTLTLTGTNTYLGNTTLSAGTLNANSSAALGDGSATNTLVFSGGTLQAGGTITSPSTRAVTLSSAGTIDTNGNPVSIAGVISGSNGLTKSGSGTLTLSGANTFTGGLTLSAGQLNVNNATALGTGAFSVSAGTTIDNTSGGAITESNNNAQAWNGDFTFTGSNDLNLGTGAVTLSASRQVTVSASTLTVGGAISGSSFGLTKAGAGALTLSGANTFTGGTTLSSGTLNINNATALGTGTFTVSTGTTIDNTSGGSITESNNNAQSWNGDFTFTGSNALNLGTGAVSLSATRAVIVSASDLTVGGVISGSTFGLTKAGAGTLTLTGVNTYTGNTAILAGTLNANSSSALGSATNTLVLSGGTLQAGGTITSPSTRAVGLPSGAGTVDTNGNSVSIAGVVSGSGGLTKSGTGTLTLSGTNTYSGSTTISAGTLNANSSAALGDGSATNTLVFSGGTLQAGGTITSPSTRTVTLSSTGTVDTNGNGVSIAGVISGANGLTKTGTGTLTLSATNTYSGTTTVSAGTVAVNGSQSSSAVTLNGGTLSGTGTTGAVTSTASGGTLSPGTPPGILSTGNVDLSSGSPTFSVALNGTTVGTNYSQLTVTGTVNITDATLSGSLGYTPTNGDAYTIINNDGNDAVTGTFAGLPQGTGLTIGGKTFRISYTGGDGNDVVLTAGGATKLAITSVPANATANVNFSVTVQSQDANGNCVAVNSNTGISLSSDGAGTLSGNTGTITVGTCTVTLSSVQDSQGETIHLTAARTSGDSLTSSSASSAIVVANGTFTTNTAVAVNGTPTVGTSTTITQGSYTPSPTSRTYQWQLCDSNGANCSDVSGATSSTYTPVAGDVGSTLKVVETVSHAGYNNGGSTSSASAAVVKGSFTTNSAVSVSGTPTVGTAFSAVAGSYTPSPTSSAYQWQLCDSNGANCSNISGATNSSYTPVAGDVGSTLKVVETVSKSGYNDGGSTSAASAQVVKGSFTTNSGVSVSGTPTVGTAFSAVAGSYAPSPTSSAYQWQLCDGSGNNCSAISGATSSSYTPVAGDVGSTLKVVETVSKSGYNDGGSTSAASAQVVKGSFTTNSGVSVSGTPTVGTAFVAIAGSYTPSPTSSAYQWQLCDSGGANCSDISGATSSSYTPVAGDVGSTLKVVETVSKSGYNDGGSTSSASAAVVKGSFTTNTGVSVSGTPTVGTAFSAVAGSYTPSPTSSAYQWQLCDSDGANCSNISGATNSSYTPVAGDVGSTLKVVETVSKSGYNDGVSTSSASAVVVKGSFTTGSGVSVSGTPTVGTAFAAIAGSYTPSPTSSAYQWQLCDSGGANCSPISGATNSSYTPVAGDVGSTLKVVETVSKSGYNDGGSTSSASAQVVKGSFTTNTAVAVNGTPTVGTSTTITQGSYTPAPTSRSYQWELCDSGGASCSPISGATSSSYTPVAGDVGSTLKVVETVSQSGYNDGGSTSGASAQVVKGSFATDSAVAVNGTPTVGTSTTITQGSYTPSPSSRTYQWELCDSGGASCSSISGATSNSYTPVAGDVGSTLKVVETVSKSGYDDSGSTSAASAQVVKGSFVTDSAVSVSGTPTVGTAFNAIAGGYSPTPTSSAYQWELCDSSGVNCSDISGATSSSYTPVAGDVGSTLKVVETVSKAGYDDGSSTSAASAQVVNGDFTTDSAVSVSGTPTVGTAFDAIAGSYSPAPDSASYEWELCDGSGNNCSNISGATGSSYTPVASDVGSTLLVVESVSKAGYNDSGSVSNVSVQVVKGDFTTNTVVAVNGTPTVGTATTITAGDYSPSPSGLSYQWELCDSGGANCSDISGATSSSYTPVAGDVGSTLRVLESVSKVGYNDGGSTSAASAAVVKGSFTTNTAAAIDGTPTVGTSTTITQGSYTPAPTSRSYQWELCDSGGANCSSISGATGNSYTPVASDVGSTLRVIETVSKAGYNDSGSTSAASAAVVEGDFTTNTGVSVSGTPTVGTAFNAIAGSYTPTPTSSSYQWQLCDSGGANCSDISGATSSSYTPVAGDVGSTLKVVETVSKAGYNDGGSTSSASASVVKGDFTTNSAVSVSGTPTVGTAFDAIAGSYSPAPDSASYQWELCDGSGNNCSNISGATSSSYTPIAGDVGSTLKVVETVSKAGYNDSGSASAASVQVVKGDFTTNNAVSVSGTPTVGTAFDASPGSYSPAPDSASYQWELCDDAGSNCSDISGATSSSYTPVAGDVGLTLRVVETVSKSGYNDGGSTSAASDQVVNGDFSTDSAVLVSSTPTVGTAFNAIAGTYTPTPTGSAYQWELCDSGGANCSDISGATSSSYTPVAGDVGLTLRVVETVSKSGYNDGGSTSAASDQVVTGDFTTDSAVSVSGTPTVGTGFDAIPGSYSPTPDSASYQWELCDSGGANCSNISGATSISYTPVAGDVGSTLKVVETVSKSGYNDGGSTSAASDQVVNGDFTTDSAVSVSGTPTVGTGFDAIPGSYSPAPDSASYQWELCDSSGSNCSDISGATSSSYTPVAGDVGSTLKVAETVSKAGYNDSGSTSAASAQVVNGDFTTNTGVSVSGTPTVGTAFDANAGSYSPAPDSASYQWELCDSSGSNCSNISGATSSSYTPVASDVGSTLSVVESVSKAGYNDSGSTSGASAQVINGDFTTDSAVSVNGTPTVGTVTTISKGSYTPSPGNRTWQWKLCDSSGNNCSSISGATNSFYTPVASDVGSTLRVVESVSRAGYNDSNSTSDASAVVINGDFVTNSPVAVTGIPTVGLPFTATAGSYSPGQTSTSYQWELCDSSGNNCSNISGAIYRRYWPVASDVGSTLRVVEMVSRAGYNDSGSTSDASAVVAKGDFVTNSAVSVSGTPTVASSFMATAGSYSPGQTSTSYQWELCGSSGNNCSSISGATTIRYYPVASDVGSTLRIVETVSRTGYNDGGSTSSASAPVAKAGFVTNTAVANNGTPTVGTASRFTQGSYTPGPTTRSYQWELCGSGGANCSNISGATGGSYTPVASDVGSTLRLVESVSRAGYNDSGSTSDASAVVVKGDFVTNTPVAINAGTPTVGTTETITKGSYTPAPSRSYQWESCDSSGNNCSNISGATNSYYTPAASDVGGTLRVVETASKAGYNDGGSTSDPSAVVVKGTFTINSGVSVSGTPSVGSAFTATAGSYSPSQTSTSYQWQLCDGGGGNCSNISGATSRTYYPVASDVGSTLQVVETVSKGGYNDSGSISSASAAVIKGDFVTSAPVAISGTPTVGTATAISKGSYTPSPTTRAYQWELCDSSGDNCSNISGATSSSYKPVPTDVGSTLRVVESVSKPGINDSSSTSGASAVVVKADFVTNYAVSVSGTPTVAQPFTATAGSYSPGQTSTSYHWELCDSSGANCSNISGATSRRYYPVASDVGSTLRIVESVSRAGYNDSGSTSAASAPVAKGDFTINSPVSVSGTPTVGSGFTATAGSYSPGQTSTSYQWELCDSSGANCSNISGATSRRYYPVASDVGSTLRIVESVSRAGYNDSGSTSAASSVVVKGDFVTNTAVAINGSPKAGTATTITKGSYTPGPTTRTYQWKRCDASGNNCTNITGATSTTYTPVPGDVGYTLRVVETVSKPGYNDGVSTSAASPPVS